MKKIFGYGIAAAVLVLPAMVLAAEFRVGEQPSVNTGERIVNDLYIAGGSITSAGSVTGDIVAGGGSVVISGAVGADVIAGGGNVTILSTVADDIRVGGGNVVIQGRVGGDIVAGGGQITIGGPGVGGDIAIGGGSVRIDAPVGGSVRVGGGSVYINAPINGSVMVEADTVTLGSAAVINGDLIYKAGKEVTKEPGAVVKGKTEFTMRAQSQIPGAALAALFSLWVIGKFLALLVCALVIGLVFKRYSRELITKVVEHPWHELGRGLIVLVALPAISAILLVTIIGIPLGILGMLSYILLMLFAWMVTPIIVGSVVYRYFSKRDWEVSWKTILLGAFLYSIVGLIPFIGGIAQVIVLLLALGATVAIKWETARHWR